MKLMTMIGAAVAKLDDVLPVLRRLGQRHAAETTIAGCSERLLPPR